LRRHPSHSTDGPDTDRTEFGFDVAIRNGLAFVGMPWALGTGSVAVFTQGTGGWVRSAAITASDKTTDDEFGRAVSFRDGLLIVGSNRAAYVYKRVNGVWREQQKIMPPVADGMALFARDLKHENGILAIGAFGHRDPNGSTDGPRFSLCVRTGRERQVRASCAIHVAERSVQGRVRSGDRHDQRYHRRRWGKRSVHPRSQQQRQLDAAAEARRIWKAR